MPIITSLKPQKDNKRVNVYLDGEYAFGIDLDNLVKFGIKVEGEFSKAEIKKIVYEAEFQKTFTKLLNFATLRPRSKKEITYWFRRKKVSKEIHSKLFEKLEKLNLLNDIEFAKWWVNQRQEFKPRAKRVLKIELRQKGIDSKVIDEVLESVDIDETKIAKNLVSKNIWRWEKYDNQKRKQKASEFLARKGFGWDVIKEVME